MFRQAVFTLALLASGAANATLLDWTASLAPGNEVPPVTGSAGSGTATGTYDMTSNLLAWNIAFSELTSQVIGMHFHEAPAGANGGVIVNIGNISGLTSPSIGSTTISDAGEAQFLAGNWYINVHTLVNPSGEIRGQVQVSSVPVPGTAVLTLAGLLGFRFLRRRERA